MGKNPNDYVEVGAGDYRYKGSVGLLGRVILYVLMAIAGLLGLTLLYEWCSKKLGLKSVTTKKDYSEPSSSNKKNKSVPVTSHNEGPQCITADAAEPHPWKSYKRMGEDVSDREVSLTPLQGKWMWREAHTIIFAPTETGKSVLAGQIAIDIAAGRESQLVPMDCPPKAQHVMYYDIEYNGDDFNGKYQEYLRANPDIKRNLTVRGSVSEYMDLLEQVYDETSKHNDNVVVFIDNLTSLLGGKNVQNFQDHATKLVDFLKDKKNLTVTFVILMHTNEVMKYGVRDKSDIKDGYNLPNTFAPVLIGLGQTHFPENEPAGEIIRVVPVKCKGGVPRNPVIVARKVSEPFLHYERICMMHESDTVKADATLPKSPQLDSTSPEMGDDEEPKSWTREKFAQPDSALPPIGVTEKVTTDEKYRLSADEFGKLHDAEKMVIYGIVKQELSNGTTGVKIAERMQERLNVKVSPTIVSTINKDTGEMRKRYADALDLDVVNKVRELYFSHNK